MDFNPLLMLVAKAVTQGEKLNLYEFPIAPLALEDDAVLRKLAAPEVVGDNFHLVLGDALRPPYPEKSFDTIITPWLIDIISEDLPVLAARINRLLKKDGIVKGDEPVPQSPSFRQQAMTTQIYSFIMSLIDGKRSIKDMAIVLESQKLMTRAEAEPAIRSFLTKMYDDSQKPAKR
jgi:ubiquinone/menaquinone biosynthesis C-methylase UbiE